MFIKLSLLCLLLLTITYGAVALSAETKEALLKNLGGKSLEERRTRLQHLGELYFGNSTNTGNQNETVVPAGAKVKSVDLTSESNIEPGIEEINQKEGVAEFLFQGDIDLSEEQLEMFEKSAVLQEGSRTKRQTDRSTALWTGKKVYYYFDAALGERTRTVVKLALHYLQTRTCLNFIEDANAVNRIRVFNGSGCYSSVGMRTQEQSLSLGSGCTAVGTAAHEFAHALGVWHTQMRHDRDSFVTVDLTNVPENNRYNFAKLSSSSSINYTPYEYGSNMHYTSNAFSASGNSLIPIDERYVRTLGARTTTFYDIKTLNDYYKCNALCAKAAAKCVNGGKPNPRKCATCNCPSGYGGVLCNQRPAGCGETLTATTLWKVRQFTFGNVSHTTTQDMFTLCNHWIKAPVGKRIQIRVTYIKDLYCRNGCTTNSIEPKIRANKMITNARICCPEMLNYVLTSSINPTPIVSYNRLKTATFTFHYRYIT